MKGNFFIGTKRFEIRDMEIKPLAANEVRIKNMAVGICGTDIHIYHGEEGSAEVVPPVVLGHEYSGIVTEVGFSVTSVKPGDHVTVDPNIYCGKCYYCHTGKKQFCKNLVAIGVNYDGGFAQYSVVPESQVYVLNPDIEFVAGAMAEPLACCIHGIEQIRIRQGYVVCVIGGGAIGLLMVQLAKLCGASTVVLSEPVEQRRKIGLETGADYAFNPLEEDLQIQIKRALGHSHVNAVIECAGNVFATAQSFQIADRGASILLFSVPQMNATHELSLFDVFKKELKIFGSFINPDTQQKAVNLINAKRIKVKPIITHCYGLHELDKAIKKQMDADSVKVIVLPNSYERESEIQ